MSTNNMAASWRQANDVIAPGWMRQVVTVVMATTQLVPSQLKNFLLLRIE